MTWRVFILGALLLLSAVTWLPDLRRFAGHPLGTTGISFNYEGVVTHVEPRAAGSGVRVGDRIDLTRATLQARIPYMALGAADAGTQLSVPMRRGPTAYVARVSTFPETSDRVYMVALRDAVQILVMVLGAMLVLRRPSPATWGLFLVLYTGLAAVNDLYLLGPVWWRVIGVNLYWVIANDGAGSYGAIIFAIYLLREGPLPRWRRFAQAATLVLAVACLIVSFWQANQLIFGSRPNGPLWIAYSVISSLPFFVAPLVLVATYFESSAGVRERLRWIILGFALSALCVALDQAGSQGNLGLIQMSYVTHSLLLCGWYFFIAVPVAYAVLKHHVIEIDVAISRATVYTILSVIVVGLFALVDLFFTRALDQKSAGLMADIGLALVLGFSFNTLHRRVDGFVDRFLFRKRHLSEEHVRSVIDAMGFARSPVHVRAMLTKEPTRAFDLTGARILTVSQDESDDVQTLGSYLESRRSAVRVTDGRWNLRSSEPGQFAPAVAVPVPSHGSVDSMVLYGLHTNGTDLDADEVALLERLCGSAGAALDRLEAQELRREVDVLRGMVRA